MMELLPLGTVFRMKKSSSVGMIVGYYPISKETGKIYHYIGVTYPIGVHSDRAFAIFDESEIGEIRHRGYEDAEAAEYRNRLYQLMETTDMKEELKKNRSEYLK